MNYMQNYTAIEVLLSYFKHIKYKIEYIYINILQICFRVIYMGDATKSTNEKPCPFELLLTGPAATNSTTFLVHDPL